MGKVSAKNQNRRPVNYWSRFNQWWRHVLEESGRRPDAAAINRWYEENAQSTWPPNDMPTMLETRIHAKCLRSVDEVRNYFRAYRAQRRGDAVPRSDFTTDIDESAAQTAPDTVTAAARVVQSRAGAAASSKASAHPLAPTPAGVSKVVGSATARTSKPASQSSVSLLLTPHAHSHKASDGGSSIVAGPSATGAVDVSNWNRVWQHNTLNAITTGAALGTGVIAGCGGQAARQHHVVSSAAGLCNGGELRAAAPPGGAGAASAVAATECPNQVNAAGGQPAPPQQQPQLFLNSQQQAFLAQRQQPAGGTSADFNGAPGSSTQLALLSQSVTAAAAVVLQPPPSARQQQPVTLQDRQQPNPNTAAGQAEPLGGVWPPVLVASSQQPFGLLQAGPSHQQQQPLLQPQPHLMACAWQPTVQSGGPDVQQRATDCGNSAAPAAEEPTTQQTAQAAAPWDSCMAREGEVAVATPMEGVICGLPNDGGEKVEGSWFMVQYPAPSQQQQQPTPMDRGTVVADAGICVLDVAVGDKLQRQQPEAGPSSGNPSPDAPSTVSHITPPAQRTFQVADLSGLLSPGSWLTAQLEDHDMDLTLCGDDSDAAPGHAVQGQTPHECATKADAARDSEAGATWLGALSSSVVETGAGRENAMQPVDPGRQLHGCRRGMGSDCGAPARTITTSSGSSVLPEQPQHSDPQYGCHGPHYPQQQQQLMHEQQQAQPSGLYHVQVKQEQPPQGPPQLLHRGQGFIGGGQGQAHVEVAASGPMQQQQRGGAEKQQEHAAGHSASAPLPPLPPLPPRLQLQHMQELLRARISQLVHSRNLAARSGAITAVASSPSLSSISGGTSSNSACANNSHLLAWGSQHTSAPLPPQQHPASSQQTSVATQLPRPLCMSQRAVASGGGTASNGPAQPVGPPIVRAGSWSQGDASARNPLLAALVARPINVAHLAQQLRLGQQLGHSLSGPVPAVEAANRGAPGGMQPWARRHSQPGNATQAVPQGHQQLGGVPGCPVTELLRQWQHAGQPGRVGPQAQGDKSLGAACGGGPPSTWGAVGEGNRQATCAGPNAATAASSGAAAAPLSIRTANAPQPHGGSGAPASQRPPLTRTFSAPATPGALTSATGVNMPAFSSSTGLPQAHPLQQDLTPQQQQPQVTGGPGLGTPGRSLGAGLLGSPPGCWDDNALAEFEGDTLWLSALLSPSASPAPASLFG
ncbi:hypothetical protein Agub_g1208 [Astrephomene gubernaculifera]|uniref:Uncharacterized protein n=1 Tax=Astrephomene gubernaculifera TaxID=47775 RepID=A0AAD3HHB9_9CHLO|nr:hypothetical protein Agub_g1208 [Astrephomene gubernaculifera]